jgi:DNA-binding transcriptional ArsR family regulator
VRTLAHDGPLPVLALAKSMRLPQPAVSKHLAVLREVGLVSVARRGRERIYRLEGEELKVIHDWSKEFERFWSHQLGRIKDRAERRAAEGADTERPQKEKNP